MVYTRSYSFLSEMESSTSGTVVMMPGMHSSEGDDSDEKENDEPSDGNKMPGLADMDDNSNLPVKIDSIGCECFDGCNVLVKFISKIFHHCNVSVRVTLPKLYFNRMRFLLVA